jgi:hypothetical protein
MTTARTATLRVEAIETGFYGDSLRKRGSVFTIASEADLGSWMRRIDAPETHRQEGARIHRQEPRGV